MNQTAQKVNSRAERFSAFMRAKPVAEPARSVASRLCVRDGRHAGACVSLHGTRVEVGSGDICDVVLTDEGMPAHAGVFVSRQNEWHLERHRVRPVEHTDSNATTNEIETQNLVVSPETENFGRRFRRRRWVVSGVTVVIIDLRVAPAIAIPTHVRRVRHVGIAAGVTVVVAGGLLALAVVVAPTLDSKIVQTSEGLVVAGFTEVALQRGPDRQVVLTGYVRDATELARLKAWTQGVKNLEVKLQVRTGQDLANRVRESVGEPDRIKVAYIGAGRVKVEGSTASLDLKRRVQSLVTEMKGVAQVEDRVSLVEMREPAQQKLMPLRIVNVMFGASPYFQTENGATYSLGAQLPDGAEVISIQPSQLFFRLNGRTIVYPLSGLSQLAKP